MWLEAYRLIETDLDETRRERWKRRMVKVFEGVGSKGGYDGAFP